MSYNDKRTIHQEDTTILNMHVPNNRAGKHEKHKLIELKGDIVKTTVVIGDFSTSLSPISRTTRQKISKDIEEINKTINQ